MLEPLPAEEQIVLLREFFDTKNPAIRDMLISRNMRLVGSIVSTKFGIPPEETDDFVSIATPGLIKAVNKFNPGRKVKFATYATRCVENEIRMFFRKTKNDPMKTAASLDECVSVDDKGGESCRYDTIASDQDVETEVSDRMMRNFNLKLLTRLIERCLDDREKFILVHRYGLMGNDKKTQKVVAGMIDVSQSYVSRLEKGIKRKLKKAAKNPS